MLAACTTDSVRYESAHIRDRLSNVRSTAAAATGARGGAGGDRSSRQGGAAAVQGAREVGGYAAAAAAIASDGGSREAGGRKRSTPDGGGVASRGTGRVDDARGEKRQASAPHGRALSGLAIRQQVRVALSRVAHYTALA